MRDGMRERSRTAVIIYLEAKLIASGLTKKSFLIVLVAENYAARHAVQQ